MLPWPNLACVLTGHGFPWPSGFHRCCRPSWCAREPVVCIARFFHQVKGVRCVWPWLVFEHADGTNSSRRHPGYSHRSSRHLSGMLRLEYVWLTIFVKRGCLNMRHRPANVGLPPVPWVTMRLGHLWQECCPWSPGLQTVSFFCEVLIIVIWSLCLDNRIFPRLHLGRWMHYSRPPS